MKKLFFCVAALFAVTACSEPEVSPELPNEEQNEPNEPEQPEEPVTPDEPTEPEPEEDVSKYYVPEESEFLGTWAVYWEKRETWEYSNDKWNLRKTEIREEADLNTYSAQFPYYLGFLHDARDQKRMIWGGWNVVQHFNDILAIIANKGDGNFNNLYIEKGLLSGDTYQWKWYPDVGNVHHMMVLLGWYDNKVAHRWEISQFDGESFTVSPPFNEDFPKPDGLPEFRYTRKYKKISIN